MSEGFLDTGGTNGPLFGMWFRDLANASAPASRWHDGRRDRAVGTAALVAGRGRAGYVAELSRGVLDPGAATVALFFAAGASTATGVEPATAWLTES